MNKIPASLRSDFSDCRFAPECVPACFGIGADFSGIRICERLVRDRLYDAACFFTSNARTGKQGEYKEPNQELSIKNFAISLHARAAAFARLGEEIKVLEANNEK